MGNLPRLEIKPLSAALQGGFFLPLGHQVKSFDRSLDLHILSPDLDLSRKLRANGQAAWWVWSKNICAKWPESSMGQVDTVRAIPGPSQNVRMRLSVWEQGVTELYVRKLGFEPGMSAPVPAVCPRHHRRPSRVLLASTSSNLSEERDTSLKGQFDPSILEPERPQGLLPKTYNLCLHFAFYMLHILFVPPFLLYCLPAFPLWIFSSVPL